MTKPSSYDILLEIQKAVDRLEDKLNRRLVTDEARIDKLEDGQSKILGGIGIIGFFFGGIITWLLEKFK
jgi:hypothetical protein